MTSSARDEIKEPKKALAEVKNTIMVSMTRMVNDNSEAFQGRSLCPLEKDGANRTKRTLLNYYGAP